MTVDRYKHYQKSFVLLSGGLDSSTALAIADHWHQKNGGVVEAVSIDYGQRHLKETQLARAQCDARGINHTILDLKGFAGNCMLTDKEMEVPDISYDEIKGVSPTYVPFRNGVMLARLAAYAQEYVSSLKDTIPLQSLEDLCTIWFGAHAEDAKNWAYPDCTPEFIGAMQNAIYIGTYRTVRLSVPFTSLDKAQIVAWGTKLGVDYSQTWSCYKGEEFHCGTCPTCRSRKQAFKDAGIKDPTIYADQLARNAE